MTPSNPSTPEQSIIDSARHVSAGWRMAAGPWAHHVGCECGGVFNEDAYKLERGERPAVIHTCARLSQDMRALREALEALDVG